MKRGFLLSVTLMTCVLCSCGASSTDVTTGQAVGLQTESIADVQDGQTSEQEKNKTEAVGHEGFLLRITTDPQEQIIIPDPAESSGVAEVTLFQNNEDLNTDYMKGSALDREGAYIGSHPLVSLPFLGLKKEVIVSNYAVGTVGEEDPQEVAVNYSYTEKGEERAAEKTVKGNCLVLVLGKKSSPIAPEGYNYDIDEYEEDKYARLAVLNYQDGSSYIVETGIYERRIEQLNLCDITGDGQDEMIVSGVGGSRRIWQVFQLSDGKWKEIKSDYYTDFSTPDEYGWTGECYNSIDDAFDSKLLDNGKAKIWSKDKNISFTKKVYVGDVVNLSELLEDEHSGVKRVHVYDQWKTCDHNIFRNANPESGICEDLSVLVGGVLCGKINVFLKYDKKADKLIINKVEFKTM